MSWRTHRDGEVWVFKLPGFLATAEVEVLWEGELYDVKVARYRQTTIRERFEGDLEGAQARALELAGVEAT